MRLDEIKKGMQVKLKYSYDTQLRLATVIGIRYIQVDNCRRRCVELLCEQNGERYKTTAWARNLRPL